MAQIQGSELYRYITENYTEILNRIQHLGRGVCEVDDLLNDILLSSSEEYIDLTPYGDSPDRALPYIIGRIRNKVNEEIKRVGGQSPIIDNITDEDNTFEFSQGSNKRNGKIINTQEVDESGLYEFWESELKASFLENPIETEGIYEGTFEPLTFNYDTVHPKGSNANNMLVAAYIYGRLHGNLVEGIGGKIALDLAEAHGKLDFNERFSRNLVNQLKGVAEILSIGLVGTGTFLLDSEPLELSEERARELIKCFDIIFSSALDAGFTVSEFNSPTEKGKKKDKDRYGKSNKERLLRVLKLLYLFHKHEGEESLLVKTLQESYMGLPLQELKLVDVRIPDIKMDVIGRDGFVEWLDELFHVDSSKNQDVVNFKQSQGLKQKDSKVFKWSKVTHINFFGRHLDITDEDSIVIYKTK